MISLIFFAKFSLYPPFLLGLLSASTSKDLHHKLMLVFISDNLS